MSCRDLRALRQSFGTLRNAGAGHRRRGRHAGRRPVEPSGGAAVEGRKGGGGETQAGRQRAPQGLPALHEEPRTRPDHVRGLSRCPTRMNRNHREQPFERVSRSQNRKQKSMLFRVPGSVPPRRNEVLTPFT